MKTAQGIFSFINANTQKFREPGEMKSVEGKTPYELIPVEALEQLALAMKEGADKYERDDWRRGNGMPWLWLIAAIVRHALALMHGEDIDPDSPNKLHHGAKIMASAAMLIYYHRYRWTFNKDDRFNPPPRTDGEKTW